MKGHRRFMIAGGGAWAAAGAASAGAASRGTTDRGAGASFVHVHRPTFGRATTLLTGWSGNVALHATADGSIDPSDLYDDASSPLPPPSSSWGVADDWSQLSTSNAMPSFASQTSESGTFDVVDEASRLLEEQEQMMHEWDTGSAGEGSSTGDGSYVRASDHDFVEDAIEVIASKFDYDEGGMRLYDTPTSLSSADDIADEVKEEVKEEEEMAYMIRCGQSPEQFLVSQGRALPELTDEEKYAPHFLLEGRLGEEAGSGDGRMLPLRPKATAFFAQAVRQIFDAHSVQVEESIEGRKAQVYVLDREALSKWMTKCVSSPLGSTDVNNANPVTFGPYDPSVSAILSRYSHSHGSGRLTLDEFEALYLEVAWAGWINDIVARKSVLDGQYPIPSTDEGVLLRGRKNTEKMLQQASLSIVWRDLEAHGIFSPLEEERVQQLLEMAHLQAKLATAGKGDHSQPLMDECELFDEYEDRLSQRAYSDENDGDVLGEERAWDFLERKEKGSYKLVEMAFDGETPRRIRDGQFVFIDEETCIGCTQCAQIAPANFKMIEESGRARTYYQSGTEDVEHAVMACPVNCMHMVSFDELKEMEVSRDEGDGRTDHRHFGGGRTHIPLHVAGIDSDANHKSSWYHYLKGKCHGSASCPTRGCYDCPRYAQGENPFFKEKHRRAEHIRARDFCKSGEADKWRKVVEL